MLAGSLAQTPRNIGVPDRIRFQARGAGKLLIINGVLELFHDQHEGMRECNAGIKGQAADGAKAPTRAVNCSSSHLAAGPGGVSLRQIPQKL